MTLTYQWQRKTAVGGSWTDIPDETGIAYNVTDSDRGFVLRVVESDTAFVYGTDSEPSAQTVPVAIAKAGFGVRVQSGKGIANHTALKTGRGIMPRAGGATKTKMAKTGRAISPRSGSGYARRS